MKKGLEVQKESFGYLKLIKFQSNRSGSDPR